MSYELLLLHELRVTVNCTSYKLFFAYELPVNLYMCITSYFLTMSYNTDEDDKFVNDNTVRSLFYKELGAH